MKNPKIHKFTDNDLSYSSCGRAGLVYSRKWAKVTCKFCLRKRK